jgi:hypothetical protein
MNKVDLDELLRSYADKPVPGLPHNLQAAVLREIRLRRETAARESFLDWLTACACDKHPAAAFVVAAMMFGAGFAWYVRNATATQPVSRALNLQVFSEQPPTLRLTNPYQQP